MHVDEYRCRHDMLVLNGQHTCSLCLGLDDTVALRVAGFGPDDFGRLGTTARARTDLDDDDLAA